MQAPKTYTNAKKILKEFQNLKKKVNKIDSETITKWLLKDNEFVYFVLSMQKNQFADGITSDEHKLISEKAELGFPYTFNYAKKKAALGIPVNVANLYLHGGFYDSIYLAGEKDGFVITNEVTKGIDLFEYWKTEIFKEQKILGLTPKNEEKMKEMALQIINKKISELWER